MKHYFSVRVAIVIVGIFVFAIIATARQTPSQTSASPSDKYITTTECTAARLGNSIPTTSIGEPVSGVTLRDPRWVQATANTPAYCSIDGVMTPVDKSPAAKPINFRVILPGSWSNRAIQLGGGGLNGSIPNL